MKHTIEEYKKCVFCNEEEDIENYVSKIVKSRKEHSCCVCQKKIDTGEYALRESGFFEGAPMSIYTCLDCVDKLLGDPADGQEEKR